DLVAALLILARGETAQAIASMDPIPVADLVANALNHAGLPPDHRDVTVEREIPPELTVRGSAPLLTRAIRNLIENAVKATQRDTPGLPGAGDVVRIGAKRCADRIIVSVADNGPGISPEDQERIFEPFYRASLGPIPDDVNGPS